MQIDWRTQLIKHGLNSFYSYGTVGGVKTAELIYDFIMEVDPFDFELQTKNILWAKALREYKKECAARIKHPNYPKEELKALSHRYYKRELINKRLSDMLQQGTVVNIDVQALNFIE
jgi:hypothetical protein